MLSRALPSIPTLRQVEQLFERLKALVHKHYGCALTYYPLVDVDLIEDAEGSRARLLLHLAHSQQPIELGGRLYIPIWQNQKVIGTAEIKKNSNKGEGLFSLTPTEIQRLHDFVSLILDSTLKQISESKGELAAQEILNASGERPRQDSIGSGQLAKDPFFLQYQERHQLVKAAVEIHESHQGFALVEYHQLTTQVAHCSRQLADLNAVTLLIPELLRLSQAQQSALVKLLERQSKAHQGPLILVGSRHSLKELSQRPEINASLLKLLRRQSSFLALPDQLTLKSLDSDTAAEVLH